MEKYVLIISTALECPNEWDNVPVQIDDINSGYLCGNAGRYFNNNGVFSAKRKTFSTDNHEYNVYVVPCLNNGADDNVKTKYLEIVVSEVIKHSEVQSEENVFLIAHDKDFNCSGHNKLAENIPGANCRCLNELLEKKHICLFQHEIIGDGYLYNCIYLIPRTREPLFDYSSCEKIVNIVERCIERNEWENPEG